MVSPYSTENLRSNNGNDPWMQSEYTGQGNANLDTDPFFDPQSLQLTNSEFKPVPLPDDDFEPFLEKFNDIDNMLTESLQLQNLAVPGGYHQQEYFDVNGYKSAPEANKRHSRKVSGSAIFGFANGHSHQLSIPGVNVTENNFKKWEDPSEYYNSNSNNLQETVYTKQPQSPQRTIEDRPEARNDFIITSETPVAFKFPANERLQPGSPTPNRTHSSQNRFHGAHHGSQQRSQGTSNFETNNGHNFSPAYLSKTHPAQENQSHNNSSSYGKESSRYRNTTNEYSPHSQQQSMNTKSNFYLIPPEGDSEKLVLTLPESNLEYSSPEDYYSSPNNSPILPHNMFISPQHNPPQGPDLQTPQKMKLQPGPKLQPGMLATPTKLTIVAKNQEDIAEKYNYNSGSLATETPKKQMTDNNDHVFWTPVLVKKEDPNSEKIIKDQAKKPTSPVRKETKITSTLPKGHLDQYFVGPDDSMKFTCVFQDCGKQFSRISNTRAHIQTHLSDRPFSCPQCPKSFVRHHDLRRHEKSHQEFTFECPCGKKFPRQDALKRHRIRKICCGGIDDDKPVSPDKKLISKPRRGRQRREDELPDELRDKILDDLNGNANDLGVPYLDESDDFQRTGSGLLLRENNGIDEEQHRSYNQEGSNSLDQFYYDSFNLQV